MEPKAQRQAAICAALGASACAGLLALWAAGRDPPVTRPIVQRNRGADAARAFVALQPSLTNSTLSTWRLGSDRDTLAALVVALGDADANVRADAVSDLGLSRDARAESLLAITAMQDAAPAVRVEALNALESLRAESRLAAFRYALDDPDTEVRQAAIDGLAELGGNASAELLRFALSDRDTAIAAAAAEALGDLRTAR